MTGQRLFPIIPNGLRYWVLPDKKEETSITVGDTTLTGSSESKEPPLQGRIVARGDALAAPDGIEFLKPRFACKYQEGDYIVFGSYAGNRHVFEGVEYTVLQEEEILGRIVEPSIQ